MGIGIGVGTIIIMVGIGIGIMADGFVPWLLVHTIAITSPKSNSTSIPTRTPITIRVRRLRISRCSAAITSQSAVRVGSEHESFSSSRSGVRRA